MPDTCHIYAKECRTQNFNEMSSSESAESVGVGGGYKQRSASRSRSKCCESETLTRSNLNDIQHPVTIGASKVYLEPCRESRTQSVDSCDSVLEAKSSCCCPSHSNNSKSCWKSKRRQIIRESSHAAGLKTNSKEATQAGAAAAIELATTTPIIDKVISTESATFRSRNASYGSYHTFLAAIRREIHQQSERVNIKISTSLPTTPNLSHLRRLKQIQPVEYEKLTTLENSDIERVRDDDEVQQLQQLRRRPPSKQQQSAQKLQQLQMSAKKLQNTDCGTDESCSALLGELKKQQQDEEAEQKERAEKQQMIIADGLTLGAVDEHAVGDDENGADRKLSQELVAAKGAKTQTVKVINNNNNNNNNSESENFNESGTAERSPLRAVICEFQTRATIEQHANNNERNTEHAPLLLSGARSTPAPLPTATQLSAISTSANNSNDSTQQSATIVDAAKNTTLTFCERCCVGSGTSMASADYALGAYALHNEPQTNFPRGEHSDRCYGAYTDSVSDLSSYRFVSDEDEIIANACCAAINETNSATVVEFDKENKKYFNTRNNNNHKTVEHILGENQCRVVTPSLRTQSPSQSHSCSCTCPPSPRTPPTSSVTARTNVPLATLLTSTAVTTAAAAAASVQKTKIAATRRASPTICCYTIDKPVSVHYNATVLEYIPNHETKAAYTTGATPIFDTVQAAKAPLLGASDFVHCAEAPVSSAFTSTSTAPASVSSASVSVSSAQGSTSSAFAPVSSAFGIVSSAFGSASSTSGSVSSAFAAPSSAPATTPHASAPVPIPKPYAARTAYKFPPSESTSITSEFPYQEKILSTSLPSDYGSVKSDSYLQQLSRKYKPPPPAPPPKPKQSSKTIYQTTVYSSSTSAAAQGEQSERERSFPDSTSTAELQQPVGIRAQPCTRYAESYIPCPTASLLTFNNSEKHHTLSAPSSRSHERSITPEHCELLSCFGAVKNSRRNEHANFVTKAKNDKRTDNECATAADARQAKKNKCYDEDRIRRNKEEEIYKEKSDDNERADNDVDDKARIIVARSLSESSCLLSVEAAATSSIANEKCAIRNKNNQPKQQQQRAPCQQQQQQGAEQTRHQQKTRLIETLTNPSALQPHSWSPRAQHNNNNNNNNIQENNNNKNNKQQISNCGDFEVQNKRSATNRKKSTSTSVYADGGALDVSTTVCAYVPSASSSNSNNTNNSYPCNGECNNNYNCKARCRTEYNTHSLRDTSYTQHCVTSAAQTQLHSATPPYLLSAPTPLHNSSQTTSVSYLSSSLPKRTLRYDSYGRLKSERVSRLPTVTKSLANGRKAASESLLHRAYQNVSGASNSLSCNNIKLTPTLSRKFNYLSDKFEDCVVEGEEELEELEVSAEVNAEVTTENNVANDIHSTEKISKNVKQNENRLTHQTFENDLNVKSVPQDYQLNRSNSDSQNCAPVLKKEDANNLNTLNPNTKPTQSTQQFFNDNFALSKTTYTDSDNNLPCRCSLKQSPLTPTQTTSSPPLTPTSPTHHSLLAPLKVSAGLNQTNSQSLPCVPATYGRQSPQWLSSETINSSHPSECKYVLDDLQSNCSDQTTIFHLDKDSSLSASSLSPSLQTQSPTSFCASNILRTPILHRRIPAIQSFGYISPIQSSSLNRANVRENGEKEINMEKRRNTLDRFQRLGFGRKSTPATSSGTSSEGSSGSRNRKSNDKSERLRELTELLRGNRSSPTPPPVPPPRKPRNGSHSASNSLELADTQTHPTAKRTVSDGGASLIDQDRIMLNQKENEEREAEATKRTSDISGKHESTPPTAAAGEGATPTTTTTLTSTTRLYDTLKPNTSLSNFESLMLMGREKSKSPPLRTAATNLAASSIAEAESANSIGKASKLTRPESRTVIGSYAQKGIPFRSASFSQIDITPTGKYKKCSWSALRDRLWRDKVVGSLDSATSATKKSGARLNEEQAATSYIPSTTIVGTDGKLKSEPDWIYIPLKKKTEMSINLNYGHDMQNLENVIESQDIIPEEDVFNTDMESSTTSQSIKEDCPTKEELGTRLIIAHAKMESLTDTIHSENDYTIEPEDVPITIEPVEAVVEMATCAIKVLEQPTIREPLNAAAVVEQNMATLIEERIQLESPPDNFLQTATTCLIPVPVFECAAQDWRLENPPQEWVEVQPEEFGIIPETIEPLITLNDCLNANPVPKLAQEYRVENVPKISVSRSSEEADDKCILRRQDTFDEDEEFSVDAVDMRRQTSLDTSDFSQRYSNDDLEDSVAGKRSSLDAITTRHSTDERKRIDKSKRRKGMYIDNAAWNESTDGEAPSTGLALDISLANLNAIKPAETMDECGVMYINSPPTDETRTPASLYSPEVNTPDSDKPPVWTKADRLKSFSLHSSEERDDVPSVGVSSASLSRSNKSFPYLRTDSVSDNESDRGLSQSRDQTSPSPVPGDYDFKRYSKRPLRGPYGQMLEKEMKKPNKMHFEEILEDLRESEFSTQPRRPRIAAYDDSSAITSHSPRNIPQHSNSMRVRKSNTYLPVPAHTRAASTPTQMESGSSKSGGGGSSSLAKINPHEKRYQSSLENSVISDSDKDYLDAGHQYPIQQQQQQPKHHHVKRAASEVPAQKGHHSKRSQSMSAEKSVSNAAHAAHQSKRSLDATISHAAGAKAKSGAAAKSSTVVPSQELLAELLKGSSEKLISEQRKQMAADTRTHVVQEILRNEQSYVESLQTIVTKYLRVLKSPEHAGMIDTRTVDEIFFMVPDILEIHEKFHADLKLRWDNWDASQRVGDVFLETFSRLEVLEVYTSFVNNCNRAKNAIRSTKHQRPSFAKFLEMTAREHKGKLTLDNLLIKPVQKFPNYEMLFQRLIKHTDRDHPDHKHIQDVLKLVHDILVHINCKEREILENGQREATLRELEGVIEGITDLIAPDRQFLLFDLVSMPSGQGARKERGFFLFNDLLVLTSIKKRSGTIRKPNTTCPGTVASTLDTNKYKFLTKISLDCLEIVKTKDESFKRIMNEIENLAEDCNKLQQIADITTSLKYPHQYLEDVIRELLRDVQRQLSERQTNDAQLNMLELLVNSPNGSQKLSIVFSKAEKRTQWEETFNEAKQKMAATLERHPIPEFLMSIPIRKTRAGLQFTCAAATLSDKRDVWVCNSDGYVGQVCIMSLYPEPNVTSCNGVCNARILCVASVPAYNPQNRNSTNSGTQLLQQQQPLQQQTQQTHPRSASTTPQHSYTQQLRDYRKSISPNFQPPIAIGSTPEKKKTPSTVVDAASFVGTNVDAGNAGAVAGAGIENQLDLNLSSSDDETDTGILNASGGGAASSNGGGAIERVPSPAPSTHTIASATLAGSSSSGTPSHHSHQDSNPDEVEANLSTMWIGTEDGCIHVYNSTDNIRIKKNRIKIEHQSAVYSILYLDNRVFVSLANGDICVYLREGSIWNTSSSHCLSIGTVTSPVTKLLNVHGKLWCSIQGIIKVLDIDTLLVVTQIQISSDSKPITNMTVSNNYVWISIQNSAHIKCFHSISHQLIAEVNLAPAVNKMLSNCDEIIRQHKAACLRVTSLLSCRDLIWIGTSAGVLLTIPAQGFEKGVQNIVPTGIPHGHTGHVRFLTFVETSGLQSEGSGSSTGSTHRDADSGIGSSSDYRSQGSTKHTKPKAESSTILVISGGDGYEDFRNSGANSLSEIAGREDSTNHLLIWQI